ncbi:M23 family metallopeptidase [Amycolatopsis cihanbeyliensis]|uniref:LasA protease n=1 Tax=Amycolatopsis cihanbeyliensis TaxID=1128664 RepID=A0A542DCS3_AMYCI|nr:M23 family metallopeptidase [Amycolatopsis cihanbeyliensis]TQJ00868.1 LasA protease [Amycolatopsis cihanbeyliensis]
MSPSTMRRRAFAAAAGLTTAVGLLVVPHATAATDPARSLDESVRAAMLTERGPETRALFGTASLAEPLVEPTRFAETEWAFGTTTIPAPATEHTAPQTALFVAQHEPQGWRVELDGTAEFVELAGQAPESVVSTGEKQLFASNFAAANQAAPMADTGLGLPWSEGVAWWMGGGPHGNSGNSRPFSSIDFNGGDGRVLSAGPGRVYKSCVRGRSALVKVVHPNGYSTTYYHMYNLTNLSNGSSVRTGTYLGHIGNELPCGGSSSGAHVHLSLLRGDSHISVDNMTIGGWTFQVGSRAYGGYAERNGATVGRGGRLTNYGGGDAPEGPTGTVDSGQYDRVNLRSGPGLDYSIVDTVTDGTVVGIDCTARGGEVDGVWGRTDLWNRLDSGNWISDGFLYTGSNDPVAPACA